jgi:DNA-binding ferritin-like protein
MPCSKLANACLDTTVKTHFAHIKVVSANFVGLHAFYGGVYEATHDMFDRFSERARANDEPIEAFTCSVPATKDDGDFIAEVRADLDALRALFTNTREKEDTTTQAMIDEALEQIEKFIWQLDAMG